LVLPPDLRWSPLFRRGGLRAAHRGCLLLMRSGMSNKFEQLIACVALIVAAGVASAAPNAQAILAASDAIRNPDKPFALTVTLVEYRNGKQADSNTLTVYSKADASSGQFRSLIRFVAPARDANKLMLKNGNDLWFFDPSSKASIRLSPQQRLLGQGRQRRCGYG
jgi:hypothetical protein